MFATLLNLKSHDHSRFSVLREQGPFELRLYQKMVCAKVQMKGNFHEVLKIGMHHLYQYLEGNNFKVSKILHYGPYFQIHRSNAWEVGIILPKEIDFLTAPKPLSRIIQIEEVYPQKVAALKFSGEISSERVIRKGEELKRWLWKNQFKVDGPLRFIRNDLGPSLAIFRHSEVLFDVA